MLRGWGLGKLTREIGGIRRKRYAIEAVKSQCFQATALRRRRGGRGMCWKRHGMYERERMFARWRSERRSALVFHSLVLFEIRGTSKLCHMPHDTFRLGPVFSVGKSAKEVIYGIQTWVIVYTFLTSGSDPPLPTNV